MEPRQPLVLAEEMAAAAKPARGRRGRASYPYLAMPAWKKPPLTRLSLGSLSLSDEVLADRDEK